MAKLNLKTAGEATIEVSEEWAAHAVGMLKYLQAASDNGVSFSPYEISFITKSALRGSPQ